jgi:hypothetical protein
LRERALERKTADEFDIPGALKERKFFDCSSHDAAFGDIGFSNKAKCNFSHNRAVLSLICSRSIAKSVWHQQNNGVNTDFPIKIFPIRIEGKFWFPEHDGFVSRGVLTIGIGHLYDLELEVPEESYHQGVFSEIAIPQSYQAIWGKAQDGRPLSLLRCTGTRSPISYRPRNQIASQTARFFAECVLIGDHVADLEDIIFTRFSAFFTGFNQWAGVPGDDQFVNFPTDSARLKRHDVIRDFGEISIVCQCRSSVTFNDISERTMSRFWQPLFIPTRGFRYDQMLEFIISFQRLLCLFQRSPVGWDNLYGELRVPPNPEKESQSRLVQLFVMIGGFQERVEQTKIHDMALTLDDIKDQWPEIVANWIQHHEQMKEVLNLYFAVVFGEHLFVEHKFLFLAQALEGYHRIGYGTRSQLSKRLAEIIRTHKGTLSIFIQDLSRFQQQVNAGRNQLAHPGEKSSPIKLNKNDLLLLVPQLRTLLEVCFLTDLKIESKHIEKIARRELLHLPAEGRRKDIVS